MVNQNGFSHLRELSMSQSTKSKAKNIAKRFLVCAGWTIGAWVLIAAHFTIHKRKPNAEHR